MILNEVNRRGRIPCLYMMIALFFPALLFSGEKKEEFKRPEKWAVPMKARGLSNLHRISNELYRGAQPVPPGYGQLKKLGIRTIVNLRMTDSDSEHLSGSKFNYVHIEMQAWMPEKEEIIRFLKLFHEKENKPIFVHCRHGSDRTGTMCAIYRIIIQGWTKEEAIREMMDGGYGFHYVWYPSLVTYIRALDIDKLKEEAGF